MKSHGVSFSYENLSPTKNGAVGLKSNLKQGSSITLDDELQKTSMNPKRLRLIQRLILKYSAKFGTSETVVNIIEKTVGRHMDGKSQVSPALFDEIERDIESQISRLDSSFYEKIEIYTPKLRALKGIKQPTLTQHSTTP